MAWLDDVTPTYVDVVTNYQFQGRTSDANEFPIVRELASTFMNASVWPYEKYKLGIALMMGHYYSLWGLTAAQSGTGQAIPGVSSTVAGPITSESVGNVSRSYGMGAKSSSGSSNVGIPTEWLMLSTYGQQWLLLMKSFKAVPSVTGELFCCPPVKLQCASYP